MSIIWVNYVPVIGMPAVGLGAIALWYLTKHIKLRYFLFGALLWAIAIAPKYVMDYTISTPFALFLYHNMSMLAVVIVLSAYVGLRTGIFESGFTYLIVKYTGMSGISFNEAMALGIGFGGIEAIFIGVQSLFTINQIVVPLDALSLLIPIAERLFVLFCHVFATMLVVYAVKLNDLRWLLASVIFKTAIDGALLIFKYFFGTGLTDTLITEGYVAVLSIIAVVGLYWLNKKYGGAPHVPEAGVADTGA